MNKDFFRNSKWIKCVWELQIKNSVRCFLWRELHAVLKLAGMFMILFIYFLLPEKFQNRMYNRRRKSCLKYFSFLLYYLMVFHSMPPLWNFHPQKNLGGIPFGLLTLLHGCLFYIWGFLGGSVVKNLPAMQDTWVRLMGWEDPLEKGMTTHSSILAWRISWTEETGGLRSMGLQRVRHDWATNLLLLSLYISILTSSFLYLDSLCFLRK